MLAVDEQTSLRAGHADVETTGEVPSTPVAIDGSTHAAANGFFDDQPARFEDIVALVHSTTAKAINDALYRDALDRAAQEQGLSLSAYVRGTALGNHPSQQSSTSGAAQPTSSGGRT
jgi:hypothetical protein